MAAITICSDFGAPKIKSETISTVSPLESCGKVQMSWFTQNRLVPGISYVLVTMYYKLSYWKSIKEQSNHYVSLGLPMNDEMSNNYLNTRYVLCF